MPKNTLKMVYLVKINIKYHWTSAIFFRFPCLKYYNFFRKELQFPVPCHLAMDACQKTWVATRKSQLFIKKKSSIQTQDISQNRKKVTRFAKKNTLSTSFGGFLGMYGLDFLCLVIWDPI